MAWESDAEVPTWPTYSEAMAMQIDPRRVNMTATFSESVTDVQFTVKDPSGAEVPGGAAGDNGNKLWTFTPGRQLDPETVYTVTVHEGKDLGGNVMSPYSWSFTTSQPDTTPPTVTGTVPAANATDVEPGTPLRVTFSEPVSNATVSVKDAAGSAVAGTQTVESATALVFAPTQPLTEETVFTAEVSRATDEAGNVMAASSWTFTTAALQPPENSPSVEYEYVSPTTDEAGEVTSSLTPAFEARVSDPDGRASTLTVQVEHDPSVPAQGSGLIWSGTSVSVPSNGWAYLSIPAGKLAKGWKTRWRARATADGVNGAWTAWHMLTVTVPSPAVARTNAQAQDPLPTDRPFNYERMTISACRQARLQSGRSYHAFGWAVVKPYTACYSRWKGWATYKTDLYTNLPKEPIKNGVMMETVVVMNTYLGNADGNGVIGIGNVGGQALRPRDISVTTSIENIRQMRDGVEVTQATTSRSSSTSTPPVRTVPPATGSSANAVWTD
ncbi:Ig-like domain-containing protein [Nonomuraea sp. NPDC049607]|uniref:Ig-like domain-containing protein n=1 Tax=Nonomuraea sp. NPDC049607 TaxID=3154732 RepID=UPI00343E00AB